MPCPRAAGVQGCGREGVRQEVLQGRCRWSTVAPSLRLPWGSCCRLSPRQLLLGHPLLSSPFALLCRAGLTQLPALSRKGVDEGPWPGLGTKPRLTKISKGRGGAGPKAPTCPAHKGARSPGLQCGGALFCSSEIPSDLQDTPAITRSNWSSACLSHAVPSNLHASSLRAGGSRDGHPALPG